MSALAGLRLVDAIPDDAPAAKRAEIVDAVLGSGAHAGLRLAEMLVDRGDTAFAKEILRKAADLDDDLYSPDAALRLGELSVADGDPAQARRFYEQALASEDATVAPEAALKMLDDIHEPPATTLERVIGLGGLAALRLGDLLAERGESDLAERAYRRVATAEHDPFSPDAQYRLSARDQQTPH